MTDDDTIINLEPCRSEKNLFKTKDMIFLDALSYLKNNEQEILSHENKKRIYKTNINIKKSIETYENNISEYSKTEVNYSQEEFVKYLFI